MTMVSSMKLEVYEIHIGITFMFRIITHMYSVYAEKPGDI